MRTHSGWIHVILKGNKRINLERALLRYFIFYLHIYLKCKTSDANVDNLPRLITKGGNHKVGVRVLNESGVRKML